MDESRAATPDSSPYLNAIAESSELAIIGKDLDGIIRSWNKGAQVIYGYEAEEVLGEHIDILRPKMHSEGADAIVVAIRAAEPLESVRTRRQRKNGEVFDAHIALTPAFEDGRLIGAVSICRDISAEVRVEERVKQSQKMEAIGRLAGGIAHDFNNLIGGIQGYASLMVELSEDNPQLSRYADTIAQACKRAAGLNKQLLAFARQGQYLRVPLDFNAIVREATELLQHTIDKRVDIHLDCHGGELKVLGDAAQLHNILINLGINARDAMPEGGELRFATRLVDLARPLQEDLSCDLPAGLYVELTAVDTGSGIPPDVLPHVFDPFFTTKPLGEGTGLGLAAVYGTVTQHGGAIGVTTEPGVGTRFRILLPLVKPEVECISPGGARRSIRGEGRIMVVDDDEMIRDSLGIYLRSLGYTVTVYEEAPAALEALGQGGKAFDLVLLDVIMPKMDGRKALQQIRTVDPDIPVIVISGFSSEATVNEIVAMGVEAFVEKPFANAYISRVIHNAIQKRRR